jgi:hypothetical protein
VLHGSTSSAQTGSVDGVETADASGEFESDRQHRAVHAPAAARTLRDFLEFDDSVSGTSTRHDFLEFDDSVSEIAPPAQLSRHEPWLPEIGGVAFGAFQREESPGVGAALDHAVVDPITRQPSVAMGTATLGQRLANVLRLRRPLPADRGRESRGTDSLSQSRLIVDFPTRQRRLTALTPGMHDLADRLRQLSVTSGHVEVWIEGGGARPGGTAGDARANWVGNELRHLVGDAAITWNTPIIRRTGQTHAPGLRAIDNQRQVIVWWSVPPALASHQPGSTSRGGVHDRD